MRTIQAELPFEIQNITLDDWTERPVMNNFFELVYIESGRGMQCINYNLYPYKTGSVFLLPPLKCHSFTIEEPTNFVFVKFTRTFFKQDASQPVDHESWFKQASYALANYNQQPGEIIPDEIERRHLVRLIDTMVYEWQKHAMNSSELIRSLMVSSLHILIRGIRQHIAHGQDSITSDNRYAEVRAYIQDNLDRPERLKIDALAAKFFISPNYMSEFFLKHGGVSLRDYITRSRLKLVEIRLLYSDFTVSEIAQEYGFTDASHLSRIFKKYVGMSIREFRKAGSYCLLKTSGPTS